MKSPGEGTTEDRLSRIRGFLTCFQTKDHYNATFNKCADLVAFQTISLTWGYPKRKLNCSSQNSSSRRMLVYLWSLYPAFLVVYSMGRCPTIPCSKFLVDIYLRRVKPGVHP